MGRWVDRKGLSLDIPTKVGPRLLVLRNRKGKKEGGPESGHSKHPLSQSQLCLQGRGTRWVCAGAGGSRVAIVNSSSDTVFTGNRDVIFLKRVLTMWCLVMEGWLIFIKMHHVFEEVPFGRGLSSAPVFCSQSWQRKLHFTEATLQLFITQIRAHVFQEDFLLGLEDTFFVFNWIFLYQHWRH